MISPDTAPVALIAAWAERADERLLARATRAARTWLVIAHGLSDAELVGMAAASAKVMEDRGITAARPRRGGS